MGVRSGGSCQEKARSGVPASALASGARIEAVKILECGREELRGAGGAERPDSDGGCHGLRQQLVWCPRSGLGHQGRITAKVDIGYP